MTEIFDEIFPNPPIKSVSCEIRFPTLLKIKDSIRDFQSIIRKGFPDYYSQKMPRVSKGGMVIDETWWVFKSYDETQTLRIKNSSIVLTFNKYNEFEPFFNIIKKYFNEFFNRNEIDTFSRIGLRYTNREDFDNKVPNLKKLMDYFTFENFKFKEIDKFENFNIQFNKKMNGYYLNITKEYGKNPENKYSLMFDFDSYITGEIKKGEYINIIADLHHNILKTFHNNITEKYKEEVLRKVIE